LYTPKGKTFSKYGKVIGTSRSDYTDIANEMGATYIPLSDPDAFLAQNLDVIVFAVSIMSFESTIREFVPYLEKDLERRRKQASSSSSSRNGQQQQQVVHGPLIVDVLSVKEHARSVLLDLLPVECDILTTHPMFGPDSGKNGWTNLNFVYERTRINQVVLDPDTSRQRQMAHGNNNNNNNNIPNIKDCFVDSTGCKHSVHEDSEAHIEAVDRIERFLSIWEEEGCRMVPMSCREHDLYTADSQFITHLTGRILGSLQGLSPTPIDTNGFQSVLRLVDTTTADSFDLFYGLYKFNQNSMDTISKLRVAMDDVVGKLQAMEQQEEEQASAAVSTSKL
jgi:arogenate dehydrogenase (NADP+), plant